MIALLAYVSGWPPIWQYDWSDALLLGALDVLITYEIVAAITHAVDGGLHFETISQKVQTWLRTKPRWYRVLFFVATSAFFVNLMGHFALDWRFLGIWR